MPKEIRLNSIHTNRDMMENLHPKRRNTPISKLIKDFTNKESGRVCDSRKEIQIRFEHLDWKDQKKILSAFLDSGMTDRQWAYSMLVYYWDKSFAPRVKELWEKHHEYRCSWPIIRYFPEKYIMSHMEEFTVNRDYYFICLRFANKKGFHVDKERLAPADYLSFLSKSGGTISKEEAQDLLFRLVHKYCVEGLVVPPGRLLASSSGWGRNVISPIMFKEVARAYDCLQMLNYRISFWFYEWDKEVQKAISRSPEYMATLNDEAPNSYDILRRRIKIAYKYSYLSLDEKYKQPTDPDVEALLLPEEQPSAESFMPEEDNPEATIRVYGPDDVPF